MAALHAPAGQTTKIIGRFSNSLSMRYRFSARPLAEGGSVSGIVTVQGSNWLFPKPAVQQPLAAENTVSKTMWDTLFSVSVVPDQDVEITLEGGRLSARLMVIALIVGIVAAAAILMVAGIG